MAKLIWKGLNKRGDQISSQHFAVTGANLRKSLNKNSKQQKKPAQKNREQEQDPGSPSDESS